MITREQLEAAIWRSTSAATAVDMVDAILTAADDYATTVAQRVLDVAILDGRQRDRRQRLSAALETAA